MLILPQKELRGRGIRYSHQTRAYQLSALRHVYAKEMFDGQLLIIQKTRIVDTIDVARPGVPHNLHELDKYLGNTRKWIPAQQLQRFDDIVRRFESERPLHQRMNDPGPVSEHGLVDGVFWYGDSEVHHIVLFRRDAEAPFPGETTDYKVEANMVLIW